MKEKSLSSKKVDSAEITQQYDMNIKYYLEENVREAVLRLDNATAKFRNLVLNANTISKGFIEISDFNFRLNELEKEIKDEIFGEKLSK